MFQLPFILNSLRVHCGYKLPLLVWGCVLPFCTEVENTHDAHHRLSTCNFGGAYFFSDRSTYSLFSCFFGFLLMLWFHDLLTLRICVFVLLYVHQFLGLIAIQTVSTGANGRRRRLRMRKMVLSRMFLQTMHPRSK